MRAINKKSTRSEARLKRERGERLHLAMSKHWLKVYECSLLIFWQFIYLRFHDQVLWMLKFRFKKYAENFNGINKFPTNGWSIKMPKSSGIRLFLRKGERLQRVEFQSICAVLTKFYGCWNSDTKSMQKNSSKSISSNEWVIHQKRPKKLWNPSPLR